VVPPVGPRSLLGGVGEPGATLHQAAGHRLFAFAGRVRAVSDSGLAVESAIDVGPRGLVDGKARPQFLIGEYEQGVFASMKAVEVRIRELGGFGDDVVGVDLINKAFGSTGPLTDAMAVKGEQEGTRALFAGAYAVLRNPSGHREVNYDDVAEAAEMVQTASLLMRILDRVEERLRTARQLWRTWSRLDCPAIFSLH
jgi:uncharacterized protein (TIGR02391 family)